jgi:hypothetical protein
MEAPDLTEKPPGHGTDALRRLAGAIGLGLGWAAAWGAFFGIFGLTISVLRPQDFDQGETLLGVVLVGAGVGFISGVLNGLLLAIAENRRPVRGLSPVRAALWGALGAAVWPLISPADDRMLFLVCPLGAACGAAWVALARGAGRPGGQNVQWRRVFAAPLESICANHD